MTERATRGGALGALWQRTQASATFELNIARRLLVKGKNQHGRAVFFRLLKLAVRRGAVAARLLDEFAAKAPLHLRPGDADAARLLEALCRSLLRAAQAAARCGAAALEMMRIGHFVGLCCVLVAAHARLFAHWRSILSEALRAFRDVAGAVSSPDDEWLLVSDDAALTQLCVAAFGGADALQAAAAAGSAASRQAREGSSRNGGRQADAAKDSGDDDEDIGGEERGLRDPKRRKVEVGAAPRLDTFALLCASNTAPERGKAKPISARPSPLPPPAPPASSAARSPSQRPPATRPVAKPVPASRVQTEPERKPQPKPEPKPRPKLAATKRTPPGGSEMDLDSIFAALEHDG